MCSRRRLHNLQAKKSPRAPGSGASQALQHLFPVLLLPPKLLPWCWNPGPGTQLPSPGVSIRTQDAAWCPLGVGGPLVLKIWASPGLLSACSLVCEMFPEVVAKNK